MLLRLSRTSVSSLRRNVASLSVSSGSALRNLSMEAAAAVPNEESEAPEGASGRSGARFGDFTLPAALVERLKEHSYDQTFGIQEQTLKLALEGRDILGKAQTGSGKTLAFLVPIIHRIHELRKNSGSGRPYSMLDGSGSPLALVLAPTRELALQIQTQADRLCPALGLKSVCVYGGAPINYQKQQLRNGCDLLIGTPGRLIDHMQNSGLDLSQVNIAALDEADEMLSAGFFDDVMQILDSTHKERQMLLFSATVPQAARTLAARFMKNPETVQLGEDMPSKVAHQAIAVNRADDVVPVVADVLLKSDAPRAIVFCNTRLKVAQTTEHLTKIGIKVAPLHSDLSQDIREYYMKRFRAGELRVLVATDVASRGIDIPDCDLVVNVEFPAMVPESYVHRTGRTGRAGRSGTAVTVYSPGDKVRSTANMLHRLVKLSPVSPPTYAEVMAASLVRIRERMAKVPAEDRALFMDAANEMAADPNLPETLASALVMLSGATKRVVRTHTHAPRDDFSFDRRSSGRGDRGDRGGFGERRGGDRRGDRGGDRRGDRGGDRRGDRGGNMRFDDNFGGDRRRGGRGNGQRDRFDGGHFSRDEGRFGGRRGDDRGADDAFYKRRSKSLDDMF